MKRIVFCADGTWQTPMNNTNVYRLYKALTVTSEQVTYYDDGVGADAQGFHRILQGAFGQGLAQKVLDGYTKIAHVYEAGDQIFLFGFSRGAYTARSLAGMIAACGLPTGVFTDDCVTKTFAAYSDPVNRTALLAELSHCGLGAATIQMVGVWDTVGSLGIPAIFGGVEKASTFLDTGLHPNIKSAYQCLAVDEHRSQFPATLWTGDPAPGQTIEQVWFSGCHCDIGGGTALVGGVDGNTRLCDITLAWMLGKAQLQGLTINSAVASLYGTLASEYALDAIRESWMPADGSPHLRPVAAGSSVADSVATRVQYALTYLPANLMLKEGPLLDDAYSLVAVMSS